MSFAFSNFGNFGDFGERTLRIFNDPETPPGGAPPADPPKSFTQEELDRIVQERLRKERQEQEKKEARIRALEEENARLKAPPAPPAPPQPEPTDVEGKLNLMRSQHQKEMEAFQKRLDDAEKARKEEHQKRLDTERDKLISDGLTANQCLDPVAGYRYFLPQVFYDETEASWMFKLKKGGTCSVLDGITEELPNYLKPASAREGGSGSSSGSPKKAAVTKALDQEQKKLAELQQKAKATGRQDDLLAATKQGRVVAEKMKELAALP